MKLVLKRFENLLKHTLIKFLKPQNMHLKYITIKHEK